MNAARRRKSMRLFGYDYTNPGAYFITVCTRRRELLFVDPAVTKIVNKSWLDLRKHHPHVELDAFVIMPNHVHGLVWLADLPDENWTRTAGIPEIVATFKRVSALRINALLGRPGDSPWQRGYWDRIARGDQSIERIRRYIVENPENWQRDPNNPKAMPGEDDFWEELFASRRLYLPGESAK